MWPLFSKDWNFCLSLKFFLNQRLECWFLYVKIGSFVSLILVVLDELYEQCCFYMSSLKVIKTYA